MKRISLCFYALVSLAILVGCVNREVEEKILGYSSNGESSSTISSSYPKSSEFDETIEMIMTDFDKKNQQISLSIINDSNHWLELPGHLVLERVENGSLTKIPMLEGFAVVDILHTVEPHSIFNYEVHLEAYPQLLPGKYQIRQIIELKDENQESYGSMRELVITFIVE